MGIAKSIQGDSMKEKNKQFVLKIHPQQEIIKICILSRTKNGNPYFNSVNGGIQQSRECSTSNIHVSFYRQMLEPNFNLWYLNPNPTLQRWKWLK